MEVRKVRRWNVRESDSPRDGQLQRLVTITLEMHRRLVAHQHWGGRHGKLKQTPQSFFFTSCLYLDRINSCAEFTESSTVVFTCIEQRPRLVKERTRRGCKVLIWEQGDDKEKSWEWDSTCRGWETGHTHTHTSRWSTSRWKNVWHKKRALFIDLKKRIATDQKMS